MLQGLQKEKRAPPGRTYLQDSSKPVYLQGSSRQGVYLQGSSRQGVYFYASSRQGVLKGLQKEKRAPPGRVYLQGSSTYRASRRAPVSRVYLQGFQKGTSG